MAITQAEIDAAIQTARMTGGEKAAQQFAAALRQQTSGMQQATPMSGGTSYYGASEISPMSGKFKGGTGLSAGYTTSDPSNTLLTTVQWDNMVKQGRITKDQATGEWIVDGQRMNSTEPLNQNDPTRPASTPNISGLSGWQWDANNKRWIANDQAGNKVLVTNKNGTWNAKQYTNKDLGTGLNQTATGGLNYAGGGNTTGYGGALGGSTGSSSGTSSGGVGSVGSTGGFTELGDAAQISDPYLDAAKKRLSDAMNTGPYSAEVQANMLSQQADMSAGAEAANAGALRNRAAAGGGSLKDPSMGAAEQELRSTRQAANAAAQRDIATKAQLENYNAQNQAAGNLGALAMSQGAFNVGEQNQNTRQNTNAKNQWNQWGQELALKKEAINKPGSNFWMGLDTRTKSA